MPAEELPLALAAVHARHEVGHRVELRVPAVEAPWEPRKLASRAGFEVVPAPATGGARTVTAVRGRLLPDFVGPGLRLLCVGLNPSLHAADAGVAYVTPSNRFWSAALVAGLVAVDRDPWAAVAAGVGFTDLVKRPTVRADELSADEYRAGFAELERLAAWLRPGAVAFVGLAGWRAAVDRRAVAGPQGVAVGGRPAYVLPSTSGLNARTSVAELAAHLRAAEAMAGARWTGSGT